MKIGEIIRKYRKEKEDDTGRSSELPGSDGSGCQ